MYKGKIWNNGGQVSVAPTGLEEDAGGDLLSIAYAMGYYLSPLTGLIRYRGARIF